MVERRARRRAGTPLALLVATVAMTGCAALPWIGGAPAEQAAPSPTTAPTQVLRVETEAGEWSLESYGTDHGPCVDLVGPDGSRQPRCPLPVLGASPSATPWVVVELTDAAGGEPEREPQWVLNGLARREVAGIRLLPRDGRPVEVRPQPLGDGDVAVFLAVLPVGVRSFEVMAYDTGGCLLQHDRHDLDPASTEAPLEPVQTPQDPGCPSPDAPPAGEGDG